MDRQTTEKLAALRAIASNDTALLAAWLRDAVSPEADRWPADLKARVIRLARERSPWVDQSIRRLGADLAPQRIPDERGATRRQEVRTDGGALSVELICAKDVPVQAIDWLWPHWLAAGKFHLLAGPPGAGKTSVALAVAAAITRAGLLPDGARAPLGTVVIWSGEDDCGDVLVPRLLACGADLSRVRFVDHATGVQGPRPFDPATDLRALQAALDSDVRFLMVDPAVSAILGDGHHNTEVRRSLQPLVDLLTATRCAGLGVHHFTKGSTGREPIERVTGSVAFGALPRIVWAAAKRREEDGGGRMLVRAKSNIGPDDGGVSYNLEQVPVPGYPEIEATRVIWGARLEGRPSELLAQADTPAPVETVEERATYGDAAAWLSAFLEGEEEVESGIIYAAAKKNQFSERTVQRARQRIGATIAVRGFGDRKKSFWRLSSAPGLPIPPIPPSDEGGEHGAIERVEVF